MSIPVRITPKASCSAGLLALACTHDNTGFFTVAFQSRRQCMQAADAGTHPLVSRMDARRPAAVVTSRPAKSLMHCGMSTPFS
jgi:hypothetical protein